ncbi:hypothetical protein [Variovorax sp. PBL-E5]|uniref:hypothetical protein n=1 Tax=Variovorax sp. PBL-E5 TaxID=434014 RepID=UPI0013A56065|nr:hypothetical protein [Variovorax sp. PBL-E5]
MIAVLILGAASGCGQLDVHSRTAGDGVASFDGLITEQSVQRFFEQVGSRDITKLVIDSVGGEPIAAIRLGTWLNAKGITIQIEKRCLSSCANYVFIGARKKIVLSPGVVAWHGGAEQKNFRERDLQYAMIEEKLRLGSPLSNQERALSEDAAKLADYRYSKALRPMQKSFYLSTGVSEYLTRAGQEPTYLGHLWTYDRQGLELFGVCHVELPAGYGSEAYLRRAKDDFGVTVVALPIDDSVRSMLEAQTRESGQRINSCP